MFYKQTETLDDLMYAVLDKLLNSPVDLTSTKGAVCGEIIGSLFSIKNPQARLSRTETKGTVFSAIGEFLWYMTKSNDLKFIEYYLRRYKTFAEEDSEKNKIIHGGYGPRIFNLSGVNQFERIVSILKKKPTSRQAVIQLFDSDDLIGNHKDIPCTTTLQFFVRDKKLSMYTSMRSNDAYRGLPHDIFAFTMLQELLARVLGAQLGEYYHAVGSLHLYEANRKEAENYISEGLQSTKLVMPKMPNENPLESVDQLLSIEQSIRKGEVIDFSKISLDIYWKDIIRLLQVYAHSKSRTLEAIESIETIKKSMTSPNYDIYIEKKYNILKSRIRK